MCLLMGCMNVEKCSDSVVSEPWQQLALVLNVHLPSFKGNKACWHAVKCLQCCG